MTNDTLLVVGYGSFLSGYGMLAERRGGGSRLVAREAFAISLENARRGLAKPSSHGSYLAMDLEPIASDRPITGRTGAKGRGVGAVGLLFDRQCAAHIARREEYSPEKFVELIELADQNAKPLGEFLLEIARDTRFDLPAYRRALFELLGYSSPGYIFHPLPLDDGRVAIVAIGSGFDGSGDSSLRSRRAECGMDRLLSLGEALALDRLDIDREGQIGYFVECILGGMHGLGVSDLTARVHANTKLRHQVARHFAAAASGERERFATATSLDSARYEERFTGLFDPGLRALLGVGF
jgi:hypothetical protein